MERDPLDELGRRRSTAGRPLVWVVLWALIFLVALALNRWRHPGDGTVELLLMSLLNSLPAAGVGLAMWMGSRQRR